MTQKLTSVVLMLALGFLASARPAHAGTKTERAKAKRAALAAKVKKGILELGTGPDARIEKRR